MKEPIDLEPLFPDRASGETLGAQLVRRLRHAIETGFFPPTARLLPSRELAKRLGIARNTVTFALEQLIAEGYLEARVGSGTFVSGTLPRGRRRTVSATRALPQSTNVLASVKSELDEVGSTAGPLRVGAPDLTHFPVRAWQRFARKHFDAIDTYLDYGQSTGLLALREAISRHVAQFRGVVAEPDHIIVVEGTQGALQLISLVLSQPGDGIAIEDPCYALARAVFKARGLVLHSALVDDAGLQIEELPRDASLAYVTPSHQFPLGGALPLSRRTALLLWAHRTNAYVIEDDYDSEFDSHPLPALQSLDREGRVIYVGTFSKTLAPGLRLGYIVAPPHLAQTFRVARAITSLGASAVVQATVADFITQGYFSRHIRRMTGIYERRRRILVESLSESLPKQFNVGPARTGLHLAITGPRDFDDITTANSMRDGQRCLPLSLLCIRRTDCKGFVLGFSSAGDVALACAATTLSRSLC
jgi:GntR family transcriptional regulator/MocR family aminotransferase